ncbi:MAG: hypothetical protein NWF06_09945 [Candidatus Bathyarchaeota archaeon]|nr:hypothetical protein [Candidatus Bathyarchaeum sp.]
MKCIICDRDTKKTYCVFHDKAYQNVVHNFEDWKLAAAVSWKEYLKAVVENSYTGTWAKEVAEHLLKKKDE